MADVFLTSWSEGIRARDVSVTVRPPSRRVKRREYGPLTHSAAKADDGRFYPTVFLELTLVGV